MRGSGGRVPPAGRFLEKSSAKTSLILGPLIVKNMTRTACLQAAVCNKLINELVQLHVALIRRKRLKKPLTDVFVLIGC